MAIETVTEIRESIEALCALISIPAEEINDPPITLTVIAEGCDCDDNFTVPAIEVRTGRGVRQRGAPGSRMTSSRDYELWFYGVEIVKQDDIAEERAATEVCEQWLDVIPDFFAQHPRLLKENAAGLVYRTDVMSDSGIGLLSKCERQFAGIRFTLPVHSARGR